MRQSHHWSHRNPHPHPHLPPHIYHHLPPTPPSSTPSTPAGAAAYAYPGDFVSSGHVFKYYEHPPATFGATASLDGQAVSLAAVAHNSRRLAEGRPAVGHATRAARRFLGSNTQRVEAGGPLSGGTLLNITFDELTRAPFLALEGDPAIAVGLSRCAFGEPPYTSALSLTPTSIVCLSPPKPATGIVPIRASLNGAQFFDTGLHFQYYAHPSVSRVTPHGGLAAGATPVTISGAGFLAFRPGGPVQRCSWGLCARGERQTTVARALDDNTLVCPSFLKGRTGSVNFSVALNGLDFVPDSSVTKLYSFYAAPTAFKGLEPTGGPDKGGTATTLYGVGFASFDGDAATARCVWGPSNSPLELRRLTAPSQLV